MRWLPWSPTRRAVLAVGTFFLVAISMAAWTRSAPVAEAQPQPSILLALTADNRLNWIASELPGFVLYSVPITGLSSGESILGIDNRPANGQIYGVSSGNRLYAISPFTGAATRVGQGTFTPMLRGASFGVDFNPVPDRLRVVSDARQNLRVNPDTGAVVDADPNTDGIQPDGNLAYDSTDRSAGAAPRIVGAAYTNSVAGATSTTNYAIDTGLDILVTQGSIGGTPVSPNTGRLFTVGSLGLDASDVVGFDITPSGRALAALTRPGATSASFYEIDLTTGAARGLGTLAGQSVRGLTVLR
jgi:hypothetical protein